MRIQEQNLGGSRILFFFFFLFTAQPHSYFFLFFSNGVFRIFVDKKILSLYLFAAIFYSLPGGDFFSGPSNGRFMILVATILEYLSVPVTVVGFCGILSFMTYCLS